MAKTEKLFSKIVMVCFLLMIILGFMVPGFLHNTGNQVDNTQQQLSEPRLCQTDADCYLTCDSQPLAVLCVQNLCSQNDCGYSYFDYDNEKPITFSLEVEVEGENENLVSKAKQGDFFVSFNENIVKIFSNKLSLNIILDKVNMLLNADCLKIDSNFYCETANMDVKTFVNEELVFDSGNYVPDVGDVIKIEYSEKSLVLVNSSLTVETNNS